MKTKLFVGNKLYDRRKFVNVIISVLYYSRVSYTNIYIYICTCVCVCVCDSDEYMIMQVTRVFMRETFAGIAFQLTINGDNLSLRCLIMIKLSNFVDRELFIIVIIASAAIKINSIFPVRCFLITKYKNQLSIGLILFSAESVNIYQIHEFIEKRKFTQKS